MCQPNNVTINGLEFYKNLLNANPKLKNLPEMKKLKKQLDNSYDNKKKTIKKDSTENQSSKCVNDKKK